jgi:plastocyanin
MFSMLRASLAVAVLALALSPSAGAETIQITIDNLEYSPGKVEARVGDTVEWVNHDPFDHTATAKGAFDVTIPAKGRGRLVVKKAQSVDYTCRFHPNMHGTLVVREK